MFNRLFNHIYSQTIDETMAYDIGTYLLSDASDLYKSSLLTALKFVPLTGDLLSGMAKAVKKHSINILYKGAIDVCGTGGDGHDTFNISTTVSLLLANKIKVAKHGNRSVSSKCGSADLIHQLKLPMPTNETSIVDQLDKANYCFLYAPDMHPNFRNIMPVRKQLKMPTIFNVLGPLCNPISLDYQVIGVYDQALMKPMAESLVKLGLKRGAIVHGHQGLDELSTTGPNKVIFIKEGVLSEDILHPKSYGIDLADLDDLKSKGPSDSLNITQNILAGASGKKSDIVAFNAGLAFYIAEESPSILEGIHMAYELINTGQTMNLINQMKGAYDVNP